MSIDHPLDLTGLDERRQMRAAQEHADLYALAEECCQLRSEVERLRVIEHDYDLMKRGLVEFREVAP